MTGNTHLAQSLDNLIQVNYERMAAFDKASQLTTDAELKNYFECRAEESERHIEELQTVFPSGYTLAQATKPKSFLPACKLFDNAVYRKKINVIIDAAKCIDKHMTEWYLKIAEGLSNVPAEVESLLKTQLMSLKSGQSELNQLMSSYKM